MQHPWILPFLPLTTAHPIQLALPHHPHHAGVQQVPTAATMQSMGLTLQPVLTPSGTLLVPALNAAAAAAAVAAAAHHHQQQQQQQQGSYSIPSPSVLINNFPRARLKVPATFIPNLLRRWSLNVSLSIPESTGYRWKSLALLSLPLYFLFKVSFWLSAAVETMTASQNDSKERGDLTNVSPFYESILLYISVCGCVYVRVTRPCFCVCNPRGRG